MSIYDHKQGDTITVVVDGELAYGADVAAGVGTVNADEGGALEFTGTLARISATYEVELAVRAHDGTTRTVSFDIDDAVELVGPSTHGA